MQRHPFCNIIHSNDHNLNQMEEKIGRILAVDDNEDILFALKLLLRPHVEIIETLTGPERLEEMMKKQDWDVILLDMNFTKDAISGQEGFDALSEVLEIDPADLCIFAFFFTKLFEFISKCFSRYLKAFLRFCEESWLNRDSKIWKFYRNI